MLRLALIIAALAVSLPASAQQSQPKPTPNEQALGKRLFQTINESLTCEAGTISLQERIAELEAQLKALKDGEKK